MSANRIFRSVVALAIAGLVTVVTYNCTTHASTLTSTLADTAAQAPRPAPDFELKDIEGKVHHLSDYKGKVVVLNFWATWCPPCKKEIPDFIEMQKQYDSQGLQFLGIAMDDEGLDKVKPWVASHNVNYPVMLKEDKVVASYGEMSSIPVTYIIDRKGIIRQSITGMRTRAIFEKELMPLLGEK